jgi:hypothetical protein
MSRKGFLFLIFSIHATCLALRSRRQTPGHTFPTSGLLYNHICPESLHPYDSLEPVGCLASEFIDTRYSGRLQWSRTPALAGVTVYIVTHYYTLLSIVTSALAVAWHRLPTADVSFPWVRKLSPVSATSLSYRLNSTSILNNPRTHQLSYLLIYPLIRRLHLSCLLHIGTDRVENTTSLLQYNYCPGNMLVCGTTN